MDFIKKNGVYLDNNILRRLAENINTKSNTRNLYSGDITDDYYPLKLIDIRPGYYDLEQVPGKYNWTINLDNILKRWYGG